MFGMNLGTSLVGVAARLGPYCWLLLSANSTEASPSRLTDDDWKRLNRGGVVVHTGEQGDEPRVEAMILIPRPAEHIWEVMVDCERAPEFVPNMRRCEVVERARDGSWELIEHEIKYRWFAPKTTYRFKADYVPQQRIHFKRVSGDLRQLEGDWGLFPFPVESGMVLVSYSVFIDPGRLVPEFLVRRALQRDLPELMLALKKRVETLYPLADNP